MGDGWWELADRKARERGAGRGKRRFPASAVFCRRWTRRLLIAPGRPGMMHAWRPPHISESWKRFRGRTASCPMSASHVWRPASFLLGSGDKTLRGRVCKLFCCCAYVVFLSRFAWFLFPALSWVDLSCDGVPAIRRTSATLLLWSFPLV